MPFSEDLKVKVKKQSHFACCLCHAIGVEIHHIVPQNEGGEDTENNAAPLCPSCHEIYGANPQKRKFITEARDFWYETCAKRYTSDASVLSDIANRLDQSVTKADFQAAMDSMAALLSGKGNSDDLISVELPDRYWVIVLGVLSQHIPMVKTKINELRELGFTPDNVKEIPPELRTALMGTLFSYGAIIDVLVERGVLKPEAAKMGAKATIETTNRIMAEQNSSSKKTPNKARTPSLRFGRCDSSPRFAQAFFWLRVFSAPKQSRRPAHLPVT